MEDMSYMRHGICIFKNVNVEVPQGAASRQKQRYSQTREGSRQEHPPWN